MNLAVAGLGHQFVRLGLDRQRAHESDHRPLRMGDRREGDLRPPPEGELGRQVGIGALPLAPQGPVGASAQRIPRLGHEPVDHPVKTLVVVEALGREPPDAFDMCGRRLGRHLDDDPAS